MCTDEQAEETEPLYGRVQGVSVKLAIESDQPISRTADELGVNQNTLHTWISKYHGPQRQKVGQVEEAHLYDELKRLRKENRRLTEERDILKKAAAYFAKESA